MRYTCVSCNVEKTKGGRERALFWFKRDLNNVFEVPKKIVSYSEHVIEYAKQGLGEGVEQEADVVIYPLGRKMKYPNGVIVTELKLFCPKVPMFEAMLDEHGNPILDEYGNPKTKFVKWLWMKGYSPDELAMNHLRILTPIS